MTTATGCPVLHGQTFADQPENTYAQLRLQGPFGWAEIAPGVHALVVTSHRAALTVLNDTETYSKDPRHWAALTQGHVPPDSPVLPMMSYRPSVLYTDGAEHARLRQAMDDCIARIAPHRLQQVTQHSSLELIAEVSERGRADLMADFADRLPLLVFAELLGCPEEMTGRMVRACQVLISAGPEAAQGSADFAGILYELIALRREEPSQDLTSWMINHRAGLTSDEAMHQLYCAVGAGVIPTAAWTAWALHLLLTDDEYVSSLVSGSLTVRRALEQALWQRSPMAAFSAHYARHATRLAGQDIPAGAPILIGHAAVNTDPTLPSDLGYGNKSHLAWSAGPHRCPAVSQATTIAQTGIETILDHLWDMAPTGEEIQLRHGPFHQSPVSLPVTFRPKSAARIRPTASAGGTA